MEKTIVQFILDNIFFFLPLGATGIIATVVLFFLPKKGPASKYDDEKSDVITFFKVHLNVYVGVYLFIWIMIFIIGLLSDFLIPTLIGGIIAAIPLVILMLFEYKTNKAKVS
jgi:hypothetical protein